MLACSGPEVGPREGRRAPGIDAQTLDGADFDLSDLRGAPVVVVFWASWCGPCRQEAPEIAALERHYGDRVRFVSVNAGEDPAVAKRAAEQWGITWPVVTDPRGAASRAFEVSAIPLVLVLDADGLVRYRGNGLPSDPHRILDGLLG
jgi:cytochrome c biogenesis protein CcmG/thiol:disulfide interchange protein DsbE